MTDKQLKWGKSQNGVGHITVIVNTGNFVCLFVCLFSKDDVTCHAVGYHRIKTVLSAWVKRNSSHNSIRRRAARKQYMLQ